MDGFDLNVSGLMAAPARFTPVCGTCPAAGGISNASPKMLKENREASDTGGDMGPAENFSMPKRAFVREAGDEIDEIQEHPHVNRTDLVFFALVGVAAAVSWLGLVPRVAGIDLLAVAAVLGGWAVFREALENLFARRMTMELSMTLALVAALAIREFSTALFILFFVLGAEILEEMTVTRGRKAIRDLLTLLPKKALIRHAGELIEVPISEVLSGNVVIIRPASKIPVDGVVVAGHSMVNQSSITGESMPAEKLPGALVFVGTTNHTGMLEVRTERVGLDTAFGRIVDAVEKSRAFARSRRETGRPFGRVDRLFCARVGPPDPGGDAQPPIHHRGRHRRRSLRRGRRDSSGRARRYWARRPQRRRGQGRPIHGSVGHRRCGGVGQNWNVDFW
jgi:cation transport ATPase